MDKKAHKNATLLTPSPMEVSINEKLATTQSTHPSSLLTTTLTHIWIWKVIKKSPHLIIVTHVSSPQAIMLQA